MKTLMKKAMIFAVVCFSLVACYRLDGDNSDYDFGDDYSTEDVYADGYYRLDNSLRLATWNVHRCTPATSSVANYDDIGYAITCMEPHVLALQELDNGTSAHSENQIYELAIRAGMSYQYCKTIDSGSGEYGIGMLYDSSLDTPTFYSGDLPGVEARKFLVAEFDEFVFIATHFCHKSDDNRTESMQIITDYVDETYGSSTKPVYLGGDLNESSLSSDMGKVLTASWSVISINSGTYFNTSSPTRIDYILVYEGNNPEYEVLGTAIPVYQDVNFNNLSDHYPVIVDIKDE